MEIPQPKHTVAEAIRLADARWPAPPGDLQLISINWCRGDAFEAPRWFSGWSQIKDAEWSWFLCYATRAGTEKGFSRVTILRVRDSGDVSTPPRT